MDLGNLPWLVTGVDTHMSVQCRASIESFQTNCAFMRLLLGMYNLVPTQSARLAEPFATNFTHKRTHASMYWHMSCQIVMSVETLAAIVAFENLSAIRRCTVRRFARIRDGR